MPEDYYPPDDTESNLPPKDAGESEDKENTALLPKSLVGEVEPGGTVTLKVVHIYEDEVEVGKADEAEPEKNMADEPGGAVGSRYGKEIEALAEE